MVESRASAGMAKGQDDVDVGEDTTGEDWCGGGGSRTKTGYSQLVLELTTISKAVNIGSLTMVFFVTRKRQ